MPKANATFYLDPEVVRMIDWLAASGWELPVGRSNVIALAVAKLAEARGGYAPRVKVIANEALKVMAGA